MSSNFDPDMTYWQSLRIVARGLIQWPFRSGEWHPFIEGVKDALYYGLSPVARLLTMILLPVSAPLITLLVQVERRKTAKAREKAVKEVREHYDKLSRPATQEGGDKEGGNRD